MTTKSDVDALYSQAHDLCVRLQDLLDNVTNDPSMDFGTADGFGTIVEGFDENLGRLRQGLRSPTFRIAIAGGFSGGKSTLLNSLFRREIMAVGLKPETANVAVIRRAPSPQEERIVVKYMSRDEFFGCVQMFCDQLGIPLTDDVRQLGETVDSLRMELDSADEKVAKLDDFSDLLHGYRRNSERLGQQEDQPYRPDILRDLTSKKDERAGGTLSLIREVEVWIHTDVLTDHTMLIDLPGTDATRGRDVRIAREYLGQVDAVIVTTLFLRPLAESDRQMIQLLNTHRETILDKLFFVVTQFDRAKGDESKNLQDSYRHILSEIERYFNITKPRFLYWTSAYVADLLHAEASGVTLDPQEERALQEFRERRTEFRSLASTYKDDDGLSVLLERYYENGGVEQLRHDLLHYFQDDCLRVKLRDACDRMTKVRSKIHEIVNPAYSNAALAKEDLMLRVGLRASKVAVESKETIEEMSHSMKVSEISPDNCRAQYGSDVAGPMEHGIEEVINEFDMLRQISLVGLGPAGGSTIGEVVWRLLKKRYGELLRNFLSEVLEKPLDRRREDGLDRLAARLFEADSDASREYDVLKVEHQRTTQICLEARANEQMTDMMNAIPQLTADQMLPDTVTKYKSELIGYFRTRYRQLHETLNNRSRIYILHCLDLYWEKLQEFFDPDRHTKDLNKSELAGDIQLPDVHRLESYMGELQALKNGVDDISSKTA